MKTNFYTGRGDGGKSLFGGKRLPKSSQLFDVLGDLDELNSWLGFCRSGLCKKNDFKLKKVSLDDILIFIEESMFMLQAEVASSGFGYSVKNFKRLDGEKIKYMEDLIVEIDDMIPPIRSFVIPGGSDIGARLDFGRAISRRVERSLIKFSEKKKISGESVAFMNRLSSLLFALARYVNYKAGIKETNPQYR